MDWKPIETAPKDSTHVLLCGDEGIDIGYFDGGVWHVSDSYDPCEPIYWMPLPEVPKE